MNIRKWLSGYTGIILRAGQPRSLHVVSTRLEHISNRSLEEKDLTHLLIITRITIIPEVIEKANDWEPDRYIAERTRTKARGKDIPSWRSVTFTRIRATNQARFGSRQKSVPTIETKGPIYSRRDAGIQTRSDRHKETTIHFS